ncbi:unnamed protein product [Cladocopium goreaui]|uniref:Uncharacterized protein n=1 Tax=Cladocopium goreaui TaxID=2562237 RepID=A0A9P1BMB7_9DINO|nr:unnamed protein product [Cladocopium goreaui]
MADRWCETFGEQRGTRLQFETFNLYHANHWIIKPATDGYAKKGCSMVELMAIQVQRPHWFVSHAWIEPVCKFLACLEQHALVRELSSSTFYWVCAYANNQHCVEEDIKSNPRSTSFYRAMQMSEGVLLVLDSAGTPFERSSVPTAVAPGTPQLERRSEKTEAPEFSPAGVANVIKVTLKFTAAAGRMPSTARLTSFESRGVRLGILRETRVHLPCPREMLRCILPPTLPEDFIAVVLEESTCSYGGSLRGETLVLRPYEIAGVI